MIYQIHASTTKIYSMLSYVYIHRRANTLRIIALLHTSTYKLVVATSTSTITSYK